MKKNEDGSLTIYIQKDSPGADKKSQLAARAERHHLSRHAPVLAQDRSAFHPPPGEGTWNRQAL